MTVGNSVPRPVTNSDRFDKLVNDLKEALGPSSGLTCDDVDVGFLTRLMQEYDANDKGWQKYAMGDASRGYTRNLVDEGNGKSNLVSCFLAIPINPLFRATY
jgi:cysteine dioxygenase